MSTSTELESNLAWFCRHSANLTKENREMRFVELWQSYTQFADHDQKTLLTHLWEQYKQLPDHGARRDLLIVLWTLYQQLADKDREHLLEKLNNVCTDIDGQFRQVLFGHIWHICSTFDKDRQAKYRPLVQKYWSDNHKPEESNYGREEQCKVYHRTLETLVSKALIKVPDEGRYAGWVVEYGEQKTLFYIYSDIFTTEDAVLRAEETRNGTRKAEFHGYKSVIAAYSFRGVTVLCPWRRLEQILGDKITASKELIVINGLSRLLQEAQERYP